MEPNQNFGGLGGLGRLSCRPFDELLLLGRRVSDEILLLVLWLILNI